MNDSESEILGLVVLISMGGRRKPITKINLTESLEIFSDNLVDIKQACIENVSDILMNTPHQTTGDAKHWVEVIAERTDESVETLELEVRKMIIKEKTEHYLRTIKRIDAIQNPVKSFNKITEVDIERAREYPIEEMYDNGRLFNGGSGRKCGRCPFHKERTPSFYIHSDNRWSCFGSCSEHGDSIAYYMKLHNVNFIQAVKALM